MLKPRAPLETFTSLENFHYLLTELELLVASGAIKWSVVSVIAARLRVDKLAATIHQVATRFENE